MDQELPKREKARRQIKRIRYKYLMLCSLTSRARMMHEQARSLRSMDYSAPNVQSGSVGQGFTKLSEAAVDLDAKVAQLSMAYDASVQKLTDEFSMLSDPSKMSVLMSIYIDGLNLKQASKVANISYDWARHIHTEALEEYYDLFMTD